MPWQQVESFQGCLVLECLVLLHSPHYSCQAASSNVSLQWHTDVAVRRCDTWLLRTDLCAGTFKSIRSRGAALQVCFFAHSSSELRAPMSIQQAIASLQHLLQQPGSTHSEAVKPSACNSSNNNNVLLRQAGAPGTTGGCTPVKLAGNWQQQAMAGPAHFWQQGPFLQSHEVALKQQGFENTPHAGILQQQQQQRPVMVLPQNNSFMPAAHQVMQLPPQHPAHPGMVMPDDQFTYLGVAPTAAAAADPGTVIAAPAYDPHSIAVHSSLGHLQSVPAMDLATVVSAPIASTVSTAEDVHHPLMMATSTNCYVAATPQAAAFDYITQGPACLAPSQKAAAYVASQQHHNTQQLPAGQQPGCQLLFSPAGTQQQQQQQSQQQQSLQSPGDASSAELLLDKFGTMTLRGQQLRNN
jgi:hypothetical protein